MFILRYQIECRIYIEKSPLHSELKSELLEIKAELEQSDKNLFLDTHRRKTHFRLVFVIVYGWNGWHPHSLTPKLPHSALNFLFDDNIDIIHFPFKMVHCSCFQLSSQCLRQCLLIWISCSHRCIQFPVISYWNAFQLYPRLHPNVIPFLSFELLWDESCTATICKTGQYLELMKLKSVKQQAFISSRFTR